jgi:hypothetical protein
LSTFIDWVRMAQYHHEADLDVIAGSVKAQVNLDCPKREEIISYGWKQHPGSHGTNVNLKSDGSTVLLSGNVGRWGRSDNVFNLDWTKTVEAANKVVNSFGLPSFTTGERIIRPSLSERDWARMKRTGVDLSHMWTGAGVSEIHITRNFLTGSSMSAKEVMGVWASQGMSRMRKGRFGDSTVVFGRGNSTHQVEAYDKASEMLAHAKNEIDRERIRKSDLYRWVLESGMVRIELKARRGFLRDSGLNYLGAISMDKLVSLFEQKTEFLLDVSPERRMRLLENFPRKLRGHALNWMSGADMSNILSRATYFRVAKQLRECGIDISERRHGVMDPSDALDKMIAELPRFSLIEAREPEWYDAAEQWGKAA